MLRNLTLAIPEVENMEWVFPYERTRLKLPWYCRLATEPKKMKKMEKCMLLTIRQTLNKTKTQL